MSPGRPTIGIPAVFTTAAWGFWHAHAHLVADTYVSAVWDAGGLPLILPPLGGDDEAALGQVLGLVDGLLIVGGADLDPSRYGQEPHDLLEETSDVRDGYEIPLIRDALTRDVPMLGVCRGIQVMNVAAGGTLHQDLAVAGYSDHRPVPGSLGSSTFHQTRVEPGSLLSSIVEAETIQTNSHHHQGVATVADGGVVTARAASDGSVEAIEWPGNRFALGVQWHPETPRTEAFFAALVEAAARHRDAA